MAETFEIPIGKITLTPQEDSATCWYACYRMMYSYAGKSKGDLDKALETAGKLGIDIKAAKLRGLLTKDYVHAAMALGLQAWIGTGTYTCDYLKWLLELTQGPLWVAGRWKSYCHNILVYGVGKDSVKVIDPWWEGTPECSVVPWSLDNFNQGVSFYLGWIGSIQTWRRG